MSERAGLFESGDDLDLTAFTPKKPTNRREALPEAIRAVSEAANFSSREPVITDQEEKAPNESWRYRTGRNVQLSLKVSAETQTAFYKLAKQGRWVLGETLARAVNALERELAAKSERFGEGSDAASHINKPLI